MEWSQQRIGWVNDDLGGLDPPPLPLLHSEPRCLVWWMHRANQAHKEWLLLVRANMTPLAKVAGQSKLVATAAAIFIASKNSRCNPVPSTFPFGAIQPLPI